MDAVQLLHVRGAHPRHPSAADRGDAIYTGDGFAYPNHGGLWMGVGEKQVFTGVVHWGTSTVSNVVGVWHVCLRRHDMARAFV